MIQKNIHSPTDAAVIVYIMRTANEHAHFCKFRTVAVRITSVREFFAV